MARARAQAHKFTDVHSWAASGVICPVKWMLYYSSQQEHLQLLMKRQQEAREAKKELPTMSAKSGGSPAGSPTVSSKQRVARAQRSLLSKKTCPVSVEATR